MHTHPSTCLPAQGPIHGAASDVARGDAFLTALVGRIDVSVAPGAASLTGGAAPTPADRAVAATLYDALALLFPPAGLLASGSYPNYARWAAATFTDPEFACAQEAAGRATGGCTRVGGQVDLRSDPAAVSRQADASIERNAGQAKAQSQRAAEDAAKAAKAAPPAAAAPAPPATTPAAGGSGAAAVAGARATEQAPATLERNRAFTEKVSEERIAATLAYLSAEGVPVGACHRHAAAPTVPELEAALTAGGIAGVRCKNLFLKAKKERAPGDSKLWLVLADVASETDLNTIGKTLGYAKDGIRFADEAVLRDNLGVAKGHVSPFCLMHDGAGLVNFVVDASLQGKSLLLHPGSNEASLECSFEVLCKWANGSGHPPMQMAFPGK